MKKEFKLKDGKSDYAKNTIRMYPCGTFLNRNHKAHVLKTFLFMTNKYT